VARPKNVALRLCDFTNVFPPALPELPVCATVACVREGDLLWTPSPQDVARANLTAFTDRLDRERGLRFSDYDALWRWSVEDLAGFWQAGGTPLTSCRRRRTPACSAAA